jgi:hypothetical protein
MIEQLALSAVLVLHAGILLLPSFGAFAILRWPRLLGLHVLVLAWYGLAPLGSLGCPLTDLENELRWSIGLPAYRVGFEQNYVYGPLGRWGFLWTAWNVCAVTAAYTLYFERRGKRSAAGILRQG